MIYGYARVSSRKQGDNNSIEQQEQEIRAKYPNAIMRHEQFTGTTVDRPVFSALIESLQSGDTIAVTKLDRFARNTVEGLETIRQLFEKGVSVHVFNIGLLENTSMGQFFITIMLAVAELERNNIIERTQSGKAIARQKIGYKDGRPRKEVINFEKFIERQKGGEITVDECCRELGISRTTYYMRVRQKQYS